MKKQGLLNRLKAVTKRLFRRETSEERVQRWLEAARARKKQEEVVEGEPNTVPGGSSVNKVAPSMSTAEKYIWLTALAVFVLMGLFPPWQYCVNSTQGFIGWYLIDHPPKEEVSCISWSHLLVQWILLWGVAGVLIYLKRKNML